MPLTIIDVLQDRQLFGALPQFRDLSSWHSWFTFLKAVNGLPMTAEEEARFCLHTGRSAYRPPVGGYAEVVAVVGVQSGKSQIASVLAGKAALTGQPGTHAVLIGQDHRGAMRVLLTYVRQPFETLDRFKAEVARITSDCIDLTNGVSLSAYPCRPEAVRGLRACVVVIDELAFFQSTDGRPTDTEMLRVARGRVAMTGGKVIVLSSPYGQSGALWELYRKHYGNDTSSTLVWQASAPQMNPTLPANYLERMAQDDPDAYRSEVLGEFRAGVATLFDPDALAACVDDGVRERRLVSGCRWFLDPASGTGRDSFTLAAAHYEADRDVTVVDLVRSWAPPFNPSGVIAECCDLIKSSGQTEAEGDRYAPGFVDEQCRAHGITYRFSERDRSQLYLELLPLVNAQQVRLLDLPDLLRELRGLERRRGPSGRDKVDHRHGLHDDVANSCAGAVVAASRVNKTPFFFQSEGVRIYGTPPPSPRAVAEPVASKSVLQTVADVASSAVSTVKQAISTTAAKLTGTAKQAAVRTHLVADDTYDGGTFNWGVPIHPRRRTPEEIAAAPAGSRTEREQHRLSQHEAEQARRRALQPGSPHQAPRVLLAE
jgi:hypothetical protein